MNVQCEDFGSYWQQKVINLFCCNSLQIWELADPQGTGFLDKQVNEIDTRRKEQATSPTNYCYMTLIYVPGKFFLLLFSMEKSGDSLQNM